MLTKFISKKPSSRRTDTSSCATKCLIPLLSLGNAFTWGALLGDQESEIEGLLSGYGVVQLWSALVILGYAMICLRACNQFRHRAKTVEEELKTYGDHTSVQAVADKPFTIVKESLSEPNFRITWSIGERTLKKHSECIATLFQKAKIKDKPEFKFETNCPLHISPDLDCAQKARIFQFFGNLPGFMAGRAIAGYMNLSDGAYWSVVIGYTLLNWMSTILETRLLRDLEYGIQLEGYIAKFSNFFKCCFGPRTFVFEPHNNLIQNTFKVIFECEKIIYQKKSDAKFMESLDANLREKFNKFPFLIEERFLKEHNDRAMVNVVGNDPNLNTPLLEITSSNNSEAPSNYGAS